MTNIPLWATLVIAAVAAAGPTITQLFNQRAALKRYELERDDSDQRVREARRAEAYAALLVAIKRAPEQMHRQQQEMRPGPEQIKIYATDINEAVALAKLHSTPIQRDKIDRAVQAFRESYYSLAGAAERAVLEAYDLGQEAQRGAGHS